MTNQKAYDAAKQHLSRVSDAVSEFLAFVLGYGCADAWENVPQGFDISSAGWLEMERKIEDAIAEDNVALVKRLGQEYERRANAYLDKWREMISQTNKKAA